jgi:hypothetical protein
MMNHGRGFNRAREADGDDERGDGQRHNVKNSAPPVNHGFILPPGIMRVLYTLGLREIQPRACPRAERAEG